MKLYTCQMSSWRKAEKLGIPFIDITVKSGDKTFAPAWDFLMEYKRDGTPQAEQKYIDKFTPLMRESFKNNKTRWMEVVNMEEVAIACYCKAGKFCHRYLVEEMLEKVCAKEGVHFERGGEL